MGPARNPLPSVRRATRRRDVIVVLTATEHIHDEVRELIRRRGIDPVTDHRSTRLLIDEVIAHYEERVPMSSLPPLLDRAGAMPARLRRPGRIRTAADGSWTIPTIEEIWINQPGRVFIARQRPLRTDHRRALRRATSATWSSGCSSRPAAGWTCRHRSSTRCCPTAAGCTR